MKKIKTILIYLIPLLMFLPIFMLRDYTPNNELRYVSIIDEAINQGSVVTFSNHGIPYADKPPLYFWLMMVGRMIAGEYLLTYIGIINILTAAGIFLVMNRWCFPKNEDATTLLPPMLSLLTTVMFTGAFVVMRMDLLMTLFIILSLYTFYKIYLGAGTKDDKALLPLFLFLAIFSKGPVGLIIPVVSIIIFLLIRKEIRTIGRYLGWQTWIILLSLCTTWFTAVYFEGGKDYLYNLLFHQTIDRAVNSFHHQEPFYFYFLRFWIWASPWALFCAGMFIKSIRDRIVSGNPLLQLFTIIILATFGVLSLVSSKVDIYLLPVYPFFIYFTFIALQQIQTGLWIRILAMLPMVAVCGALPASLILPHDYPLPLQSESLLMISATILSISGIMSLYLLFGKKQTGSAVGLCSGGIILFIFMNSFQIPSFNDYLGMKGIASQGTELGRKYKTPRYVSYGIGRAENMEVYLRTPLVKKDTVTDLLKGEMQRPYILFTRTKTIEQETLFRDWLQGKERKCAGKYEVYYIE